MAAHRIQIMNYGPNGTLSIRYTRATSCLDKPDYLQIAECCRDSSAIALWFAQVTPAIVWHMRQHGEIVSWSEIIPCTRATSCVDKSGYL